MVEEMNGVPVVGAMQGGPKDSAKSEAPARPELTEGIRQAIRDLENEQLMPARSKVLALATFLRLKPASEIATVESPDKQLVSVAKTSVGAILDKLKLRHVSRTRDSGNGFCFERFFIALSDEDAANLQVLMESGDRSPERAQQIGEALGLPRTAVDAWESRVRTKDDSLILSYEERRQCFGPELGAFFLFAPSRAHWQEEKVWLQNLVDRIKEVSPNIYQQALREGS